MLRILCTNIMVRCFFFSFAIWALISYLNIGSAKIPHALSFLSIMSDALSKSVAKQFAFKKKVSILCGMVALFVYDSTFLGFLKLDQWTIIPILGLGFFHFYLMEQEVNGKLNIRPFGYLSLVAPLLVVGMRLYSTY